MPVETAAPTDPGTRTPSAPAPHAGGTIRPATLEDARDVWALAEADAVIDTNSPYAYVMAADAWRETFLVARDEDGRLAGYVLGVPWPARDAVFVWQIAVAPHARRRGLAHRLLCALADVARAAGRTRIHATVAPANAASAALFTRFARTQGAPCDISEGYPGHLFPEPGSRGERLYDIGPLPADAA